MGSSVAAREVTMPQASEKIAEVRMAAAWTGVVAMEVACEEAARKEAAPEVALLGGQR